MTLLTYIESENGKIKKAGLEVASYGKALADQLNYSTVALVFGVDDATILHNYGIEKILNVKSSISFEAELFADIIKQAAEKEQSNVIMRVLAYAGVIVNDPTIIQVAQQEVLQEEQNSKQ